MRVLHLHRAKYAETGLDPQRELHFITYGDVLFDLSRERLVAEAQSMKVFTSVHAFNRGELERDEDFFALDGASERCLGHGKRGRILDLEAVHYQQNTTQAPESERVGICRLWVYLQSTRVEEAWRLYSCDRRVTIWGSFFSGASVAGINVHNPSDIRGFQPVNHK